MSEQLSKKQGYTVRVVRYLPDGNEVGQVGILACVYEHGVLIRCESKSILYPWHTVVRIEIEDDE